MSLENQGTDAGQGMTPDAGPGTVWRVTLAWPETSTTGRQERVDGLQQLLSTRAVVGLMGPGRPTRGGMVVDLVLPVEQTRILTASRDGQLNAGAVGDDFAWELHRFTGAVVVNGDLATGDFAVDRHSESASEYLTSLAMCIPVSQAAGGPGLGSLWGRAAALRLLRQAGFTSVEVAGSPTGHAVFACRSDRPTGRPSPD